MASTAQSWASWLLDSYVSSVSPLTTDSSDRQHDEPPDADDFDNPTSSSSGYGPYVRTGRGGAGNFTWQTQLNPPRSTSPEDLEAQEPTKRVTLAERRRATAKLEHLNIQETMRMRQSSAPYLSQGRGGAGNFTSNSLDAREARRSPSLPLSLDSTTTRKPSSPTIQYTGRGGAGNYSAAADIHGKAESEKDQEERLAADQRRELIAVEVDGLLQPPPGAWLGGGRSKSESMFGDE